MTPSQVDSFGLIKISKEELLQLSHTNHSSNAKRVGDIDPTIAIARL